MEKPLMNLKELCVYLGLSETAVRRIVYNEGWKFRKDRYFSKVLVDKWLSERGEKDKSEEDDRIDKMVNNILGNVYATEEI